MARARTILLDTFHRLRRSRSPILVALTLAELAAALVLLPMGAATTDWLVRRTGRYAVANEDLVGFIASPLGVSVLLSSAVAIVLASHLGAAATMIASCTERATCRGAGVLAFLGALRRLPVLIQLSVRQVVSGAILVAPFLVAVGLVAWLVVRDVDLYWLVNVRPTRFWIGVAFAGPIAAAGAALLLRRMFAWSIAMPLCVQSRHAPREAMRMSVSLLRGKLGSVAIVRLGWWAACAAVGFGGLAIARAIGDAVLRREFASIGATALAAAGVLLLYAAVTAITALVARGGDALVIMALWRSVTGGDGIDRSDQSASALAPSPWSRLILLTTLGAATVAAVVGTATILESIHVPIKVEITAHRGAAAVAPENTFAAIEAAIALKADRIEIDAMRTADDAVVVFHDTDLRRLVGDPRRVNEMTLAELQVLDVGAWFSAAFAGERIPTIEEVVNVTRGRAALNIELKASGDERDLAEAVAAIVAARLHEPRSLMGSTAAPEIVVTSLSIRALEEVRRADPSIRIGLIVTASTGDLRRLDVDFLVVDSRLASSRFLARAAAAGLPVNVWNVSDADQFTQLALRGVSGVITPDVEPMRTRLEELGKLDGIERLLLAVRSRLLGTIPP